MFGEAVSKHGKQVKSEMVNRMYENLDILKKEIPRALNWRQEALKHRTSSEEN